MPVTLAQFLAAKRRRSGLWPSLGVFLEDLTIFGLGAAGAYTVSVGGSLPGCEIIAALLLPYLLVTYKDLSFVQKYRCFYILLALWLFGTVLNDTYLGVSLLDRIKGIARIVFLGIDFTVLAILLDTTGRKIRGAVVFALSIVFVLLVFCYQARGGGSDIQWKFGGSEATTIVALLISCYFFQKARYAICLAITCGFAFLNLVMAFRSQMAIIFISGLLIMPIVGGRLPVSKRGMGRVLQAARILFIVALAGGGAFLANKVILYAAEKGYFDPATQEKFESQSNGKLGVLAGGRPETLVAIRAIRDSPIVGHGSFAVDPHYWYMEQDIEYEYGYENTDAVVDLEDPGIPTHSHLTLAWVESGILGGVFWIYILFLTLYSILVLIRSRPILTPLYCYLLINFTWDILFSPMGAANRIWNAYTIIISYQVIRAEAANLASIRARRKNPLYVGKRSSLVKGINRPLTPQRRWPAPKL